MSRASHTGKNPSILVGLVEDRASEVLHNPVIQDGESIQERSATHGWEQGSARPLNRNVSQLRGGFSLEIEKRPGPASRPVRGEVGQHTGSEK